MFEQKLQRQLQEPPTHKQNMTYNPEDILDKVFDFKDSELKLVALWNMKNDPEFEMQVNELAERKLAAKIEVSYGDEGHFYDGKIVLNKKQNSYFLASDGQLHMHSLNDILSHELAHAHQFYTKFFTQERLAGILQIPPSRYITKSSLPQHANLGSTTNNWACRPYKSTNQANTC